MHTMANENLVFHVRSSPVISTHGLAVVSRCFTRCGEYQNALNVVVSIRAGKSRSNPLGLATVIGSRDLFLAALAILPFEIVLPHVDGGTKTSVVQSGSIVET